MIILDTEKKNMVAFFVIQARNGHFLISTTLCKMPEKGFITSRSVLILTEHGGWFVFIMQKKWSPVPKKTQLKATLGPLQVVALHQCGKPADVVGVCDVCLRWWVVNVRVGDVERVRPAAR